MATTPTADLEERLQELGIIPGRKQETDAALEVVRHAENDDRKTEVVFVQRLSNHSDGT
jgi:hypothetical protein